LLPIQIRGSHGGAERLQRGGKRNGKFQATTLGKRPQLGHRAYAGNAPPFRSFKSAA